MSLSVTLEYRNSIAIIGLNDPDRRNAMSEEMTRLFPQVVAEISESNAKAIVVTGAGTAFCAGGNLGFIHGQNDSAVDIRERMSSFYPKFLTLLSCDLPTIAAVNGHAVGAGMCLALMCDMRIVAKGAKLSMPFVRLGIHPGMMATALLERACGSSHAADLLFTGRPIDAEEAFRMGIANRVCPSDEILDDALVLANEIAANAPIALRYLKQGLREMFRDQYARASAWEGFAQAMTMQTQDVAEGLAAVKEKRAPKFSGS